ncbi:CREB-binding protein-like [Neocloeon triangulifer]|uniref:CREB-binding protein-like n=1 Tax=Neocloeon triangulifer TaxID=2078957 RepID=UPI00286F5B8A|nr:CREB-binding protein-like [Neocloeon triangulifer]XP_059474268.1 CREB-binding protein-like [Neocloeon triangulifer]XP_059474269.1 CREB-binding protein-like [Neocloeon triangulifer]
MEADPFSQSDCGSVNDLPANIDQYAVSRCITNKIAQSPAHKVFDTENEPSCPHQTEVQQQLLRPILDNIRKYSIDARSNAESDEILSKLDNGEYGPDPRHFTDDVHDLFKNALSKKKGKAKSDLTKFYETVKKDMDMAMKKLGYCCGRKYEIPKIIDEFIKCSECGHKQHPICELYVEEIIPHGFTCSFCLLKNGVQRTVLRVKDVFPKSKDWCRRTEQRVSNLLTEENREAAKVRIIELSSPDKSCLVSPEMKERYKGKFPDSFPFTQKVIVAFLETEEADVLFFCMYVQEYGSECPEPNRNKAYISYLDTVQFSELGNLRTRFYHIILNGQAEDAEKRGVEQIHLWSCPPIEGVDYIFNKHPPQQRVLPQKKLEEWYKKRYPGLKNVCEEIQERKISSPTQLPYFDGHGFPILMEDILSKDKEIKSGGSRSKRQKLQPSNNEQLWLKIVSAVRKKKFLVLDLTPIPEAEIVQPIKEPPELLLYSGMMADREGFLGFCIDRNLRFSSLPEARFATWVILREEVLLRNKKTSDV